MYIYIGTYTRMGGPGIAVCSYCDETGELKPESVSPELKDPTYLILSGDRKTLFATSSGPAEGGKGGSVASYAVDGGKLVFKSAGSTGGESPCHLTLSHDERFLYVANYMSGSLAVFPVENGNITGPAIQLIKHEGKGPHPSRQQNAHLHHVTFIPETSLLCSIDLGIDAVVTYFQDKEKGILKFSDRMDCSPGLGPRHLAYDPAAAGDSAVAYLAHELGSAVSVIKREGGCWKTLQTLSTLPEGWTGSNTCAAVKVSADGKRVFVSNRGHDSIAEFAAIDIDDGGRRIELLRIFKTGGVIPRDFVLLKKGRIMAAHQEGGGVIVLDADKTGGNGVRIVSSLEIKGAVCVCPSED